MYGLPISPCSVAHGCQQEAHAWHTLKNDAYASHTLLMIGALGPYQVHSVNGCNDSLDFFYHY
jgi:hypothetical protein